MGERERPVFNIGIPLAVLIFMNLCLIVFAVLSLENAVSDRSLTQKTLDHTSLYYTSYSDIEEEWGKINDLLLEYRDYYGDQKTYLRMVKKYLEEEGYLLQEEKDGLHIFCSSQLGEHQSLYGRAKILWKEDRNENSLLEIEEMKLGESGSWEADQSIRVYDGK